MTRWEGYPLLRRQTHTQTIFAEPVTVCPVRFCRQDMRALLLALLAAAVDPAHSELAVAKPALSTAPLSVPHKLLHGPGPSSAHPRTLLTGALPMVSDSSSPFAVGQLSPHQLTPDAPACSLATCTPSSATSCQARAARVCA